MPLALAADSQGPRITVPSFMEHVAADCSAIPLSSTATFKIVLVNGRLRDLDNGETAWSEPLACGWRFGIGQNDDRFTSTHFDWYQATLPTNKLLIISTIRASSDGKRTDYLDTQLVSIGGGWLHLLESSSFKKRPVISFIVTVASRFGVESKLTASALSSSLRGELNASLVHGDFSDVKFFVFSRRRATGGASLPGSIFANSSILKATSGYFRSCKRYESQLSMDGLTNLSEL